MCKDYKACFHHRTFPNDQESTVVLLPVFPSEEPASKFCCGAVVLPYKKSPWSGGRTFVTMWAGCVVTDCSNIAKHVTHLTL